MEGGGGEILQLPCTELCQGVHVDAAVLVDEAVDWELVDVAREVLVVPGLVQISVTARSTPAPLGAGLAGDVVRAGVTPAAPAQSQSVTSSLSTEVSVTYLYRGSSVSSSG